jgi:hypothetical protein
MLGRRERQVALKLRCGVVVHAAFTRKGFGINHEPADGEVFTRYKDYCDRTAALDDPVTFEYGERTLKRYPPLRRTTDVNRYGSRLDIDGGIPSSICRKACSQYPIRPKHITQNGIV